MSVTVDTATWRRWATNNSRGAPMSVTVRTGFTTTTFPEAEDWYVDEAGHLHVYEDAPEDEVRPRIATFTKGAWDSATSAE